MNFRKMSLFVVFALVAVSLGPTTHHSALSPSRANALLADGGKPMAAAADSAWSFGFIGFNPHGRRRKTNATTAADRAWSFGFIGLNPHGRRRTTNATTAADSTRGFGFIGFNPHGRRGKTNASAAYTDHTSILGVAESLAGHGESASKVPVAHCG